MDMPEVIDLTALSSSPPICLNNNDRTPNAGRTTEDLKTSVIDKDANVPLEEGELPRLPELAAATPPKQRKRKKSQQDTVKIKDENVDKRRRRGGERDNSHSPDRVARERPLHEIPSESLFFVDDKLVDIRGSYAPTLLAGPSGTQRNGGLVLPPHVNVAGESSETGGPSLPAFSDGEGDEEDFIDYLDVDGDRSVCLPLAEPHPRTLIPKNEILKDWCCSVFPRYPRNGYQDPICLQELWRGRQTQS